MTTDQKSPTSEPTDNPWPNWMTAVLACARDAAARAMLEEPRLLHLLDPDGVAPVVVVDLALRRCDVWFKGRDQSTSIHAGHITEAGEWMCAALAPARERPGQQYQ